MLCDAHFVLGGFLGTMLPISQWSAEYVKYMRRPKARLVIDVLLWLLLAFFVVNMILYR